MNHVMICIRFDLLKFGLVERPGSTKYRVRHPKFYFLEFRHRRGRIMIIWGEDDVSAHLSTKKMFQQCLRGFWRQNGAKVTRQVSLFW